VQINVQSATTPLYLEHERPWIDLEVEGRDEKRHRMRFMIDTGGDAILLTEAMADELGIVITGHNLIEELGMSLEPVNPPAFFLGNMRIDARTDAFVLRQKQTENLNGSLPAMISGRALAGYRLTFDIPHQRFTISDLGNAWASGEMLLSPVHPQTGFARVEIEVAGERYGMLLDTGAGCTMVSPRIFEHWSQEHPEWPQIRGAFGSANKGQRNLDEGARMMRIPQFSLGFSQLEGICIVARQEGNRLEASSEQMLTGPAIGALGGNVLKHFCYEINYSTGVSHLRQQSQSDQQDLDMVGLSLTPVEDGGWAILAIAESNDPRVLTTVQVGDLLLEIDNQPVIGRPLEQVIDALRGWPGDRRILLLERDVATPRAGTTYRVEAPVVQLLP
jgi:predicted aspartyl protease